MQFEVVGDEVLSVEEVVTSSQTAIVKRHYKFLKQIVLNTTTNITNINVPIQITVKWQDWQGNDLLEETSDIKITITGTGQSAEQTLTPANGQIEFDFESSVAGTFIIQTGVDFPCDFAELEVIVNE